jgi:glycine/serine hydroxymethyltransferase
MGVPEAREIGKIIGEALTDIGMRQKVARLRDRVTDLTARYDVP